MKCFFVIIVVSISLSESVSLNPERADSSTVSKGNATSEQKVWNIKLDIYFSKTLPSLIKKVHGEDMRLRCEATMNFTRVEKTTKNKEGVETSQAELPPDHILQTLMKNVKMYWLKDTKIITNTTRLKIFNRMDKKNGTLGTHLRIKDIDDSDEANYTCVIRQSYEKKQTTMLKVLKDDENDELPKYTSFLPSAEVNNQLEMLIKTTPDLLSQDIRSQHASVTPAPNTTITRKLEPICQEYVGNVCAAHLKGQFVYIPYNTTQLAVEDKLMKALQVTKYSNDISSNCEGFALPSLCYSTFPICRNPIITNNNFFREAKQVFTQPASVDSAKDDTPWVIFDNSPVGLIPQFNRNLTAQPFDYRYNSTVLKRVCKQDCEILENELCQTEYAIAKRHPHIGQQLTLEECQSLPENDSECLKIGIGDLMVSDDECYWEYGQGYLGKVNTAGNGMACIEWSKQLRIKISDYPELTGLHSYCRNPGGKEEQPWCMVDKEGRLEVQLCDIPKCALKIWIYIVVIFLLLTLSIVSFIVCLCYKNKNKNNAAAIRDINLPNADKNIYGNSRLNSPIEMSELLTNQNIANQPHLTRNTRGNGILRIPQYSLSQIKFLEELGEGAFGKVYKGALKKNGETHYVAVKALKENASAKTQADFRREIDLISELTHDNIVCIVGVALSEEPLCMLFEFMARGDLHEFLMGRAPPSGKGLPPMRLLSIAHNIASGMQYLASHHYVHRDLAARNCLVSDDFVVKISDFGLSRDIYSSDYYRVQSKSLLPVRWMPPESILYGKFTTESDIWSYGVVLWEIYSYGLQPYYGYSNQEVIAMVRGGELLAAPAACPAPMYALMRDCWRHMPQRRPNFEEIVVRIQGWITTGGCPETAASESGSSECGRGSARELQERAPLLPPHCSASNGSLPTGSLKKLSVAGSSSRVDETCSTCSEGPPLAPKKKHSSGSLIDDRGTKDTVVRIQNTQYGNEI
ncbi:tyrosine-protein kinase transmembrane receptor Ror [Leguminivora glycinivorella]|uniref:tyrosine-protein kinase transmembrane receptor Ror n=1 Tax=Leguminivora glycinivorella TaxID=1035111 RepID=UPI00200FC3F2|nr:tyrosine-protein kinase transmembrane receptor Ror [Leguminivora glycinivorella]